MNHVHVHIQMHHHIDIHVHTHVHVHRHMYMYTNAIWPTLLGELTRDFELRMASQLLPVAQGYEEDQGPGTADRCGLWVEGPEASGYRHSDLAPQHLGTWTLQAGFG